MMEHQPPSQTSGYQRSGGARNRPATGGEGKPNKISQSKQSQYPGVGKDKMGLHSADKPRHYADADVRGDVAGTRGLRMDESTGSPTREHPPT